MLDEERIDAALEAMARPEPRADAVARVLARTGPGVARPAMARVLSPDSPTRPQREQHLYGRRACGPAGRPVRRHPRPDAILHALQSPWLTAPAALCLAVATMWFVWRPDTPVAPAPGTLVVDAVNPPALVSRQPAPVTAAAHDEPPEPRRVHSRASNTRRASAFVPVPVLVAYADVVPPRADLEAIEVPPIAIEDITQTSIDIEPLPALEPIAIAAIPLAPLDAIDNQENP